MNTKKFWGNFFMALGGGIAVLCGGCAVIFEIMALTQPSSGGGENFLTPVLPPIIGGIPALIGVGLFFLGRKIKRSPAKPTSGAK